MPTYHASPEFLKLHAQLSAHQKGLFRAAVVKFIEDLQRGQGFRKGLRVKGIKGAPGFYEMTWAPDGRAVFSYGDSIQEGEPHILWHAIGTHSVLP
ncbi:MAG: hypothetical protein M3R39_06820 [Actinomycetota bacterium]|nr:hypothetical protein [Actinomycetota bacterium]